MKPIAPKFEWRPRRVFRGLRFDGIDDGITVPSSDLLNIQAGNKISIVMFARFRYAGRTCVVIDKRTDRYANYNWEYSSNTMFMRVHANGAYYIVSVPFEFDVDSMFTMVLNGSTLYGYLNDELKSTRSVPYSSGSNTVTLYIFEGRGEVFQTVGTLYALMIYSRALSDSEVKYIYNNPHNPPQDGLVLWLAPGSIDPINGKWWDLSPYGNHGTIYGATVVEEEEEVEVL